MQQSAGGCMPMERGEAGPLRARPRTALPPQAGCVGPVLLTQAVGTETKCPCECIQVHCRPSPLLAQLLWPAVQQGEVNTPHVGEERVAGKPRWAEQRGGVAAPAGPLPQCKGPPAMGTSPVPMSPLWEALSGHLSKNPLWDSPSSRTIFLNSMCSSPQSVIFISLLSVPPMRIQVSRRKGKKLNICKPNV